MILSPSITLVEIAKKWWNYFAEKVTGTKELEDGTIVVTKTNEIIGKIEKPKASNTGSPSPKTRITWRFLVLFALIVAAFFGTIKLVGLLGIKAPKKIVLPKILKRR
jgi:hypothetical protein